MPAAVAFQRHVHHTGSTCKGRQQLTAERIADGNLRQHLARFRSPHSDAGCPQLPGDARASKTNRWSPRSSNPPIPLGTNRIMMNIGHTEMLLLVAGITRVLIVLHSPIGMMTADVSGFRFRTTRFPWRSAGVVALKKPIFQPERREKPMMILSAL